jgi:hypothetical protein
MGSTIIIEDRGTGPGFYGPPLIHTYIHAGVMELDVASQVYAVLCHGCLVWIF